MPEKWRKGRAPWEDTGPKEKDIEKYLREQVKKLSGVAYKFISPGHNGVPDRMVVLPGGIIVFVELKAPGKQSTAEQRLKQQELAKLGCTVFSDIDTVEKVNQVIEYCRRLL